MFSLSDSSQQDVRQLFSKNPASSSVYEKNVVVEIKDFV